MISESDIVLEYAANVCPHSIWNRSEKFKQAPMLLQHHIPEYSNEQKALRDMEYHPTRLPSHMT
jgi:hypothetical protein